MQRSILLSDIQDKILLDELSEMDELFFPTPWLKSQWVLAQKNTNLFVQLLKESNKLIGYCLYSLNRLEGLAHLYKIVIKPEARNMGAAFHLMEESFSYISREGLDSIFLEVSTRNKAALRLYIKLGFEELNTIRGYYSNGDDAVAMRRRIL